MRESAFVIMLTLIWDWSFMFHTKSSSFIKEHLDFGEQQQQQEQQQNSFSLICCSVGENV